MDYENDAMQGSFCIENPNEGIGVSIELLLSWFTFYFNRMVVYSSISIDTSRDISKFIIYYQYGS